MPSEYIGKLYNRLLAKFIKYYEDENEEFNKKVKEKKKSLKQIEIWKDRLEKYRRTKSVYVKRKSNFAGLDYETVNKLSKIEDSFQIKKVFKQKHNNKITNK